MTKINKHKILTEEKAENNLLAVAEIFVLKLRNQHVTKVKRRTVDYGSNKKDEFSLQLLFVFIFSRSMH